MEVTREHNAEFVNYVFNHESVHPWIRANLGADYKIDMTEKMAQPNVHVLRSEHGVIVFDQMQTGYYEFHCGVLPEGRGAAAITSARMAYDYMFTHTDAVELLTRVSVDNPPAEQLAKISGCKLDFVTRPIWPSNHSPDLQCMKVFSLKLQDWVHRADYLLKVGDWFHDEFERQLQKIDPELLAAHHEDDAVHNLYVGAAVEMFRNGQQRKGIAFYNRWAALASYEQAIVVNLDPITISLGVFKLVIGKDNFEVVL